ncbi:hypothetical protein HOLleu_13831 [Holothuria leucospilota]|uniref:Uncharacterized protein n=1 Tax=Holothuria leucospilota TaxID=206669 RepID=A0A9Q1HB92_HOLLE|nr:hypothetical protein HOLleu_13831 [Holothuria leucospilota]
MWAKLSLPSLTTGTHLRVLGSHSKYLTGLRQFKVEGIGGRFVVDRDTLQGMLQKRKLQDSICGQEVNLELPKSLPHSSYNVSREGEVIVFYVTITDHTLADELPDTLQERIAITYQCFVVAVPVIVGTIEKHGLLNLGILTNSTTKILSPFTTSTNDYTFVDAIVEEDDTVSIRLGDDILTLQVQKDVKTMGKWNVGKDFDKVTVVIVPCYIIAQTIRRIMEYTRFFVVLLISLPFRTLYMVYGSQQTVLSDLRRFQNRGVGGRFIVNRDALERELQNRKQQDAACGQGMPVLVGETENHGLLYLHLLTNNTKKVLIPYATSNNEVTYIDSIEEEEDGQVTLRLGVDSMTFQVQDAFKDSSEKNVGRDFDKVIGKFITTTNYPLSFDWDCQLLGSQISFCQVLNEFWCKMAAFAGDVCAVTSTSSSKRLPTTMMIIKMTGKFREMFPYLAETVPCKSFEAESFDREHTTGVVYPCTTM